MTLFPFNKKLMKFIHTLTRCDSFPTDDELAKRMGVTRKTIRNWFHYLNKPYSYKDFHAHRKLSYYPAIKKNLLGLQFMTVLFYNGKEEITSLWPNKNYLGRLFDFTDGESVLVVEYLVPKSQVEEFRQLLGRVRDMKLCSDIRIFETSPSFTIYAPFHKVIDENGKFHYDRVDNSSIMEERRRLSSFLESIDNERTSSLIQKTPLIVPVIAEYQYEQRKSIQVWNAIKAKVGNAVWDYIPNANKQTDGVGIQAVQSAIKALSKSELFTQMRIVYFPVQFRGFCSWVILEFGAQKDLIELAANWLHYSHTMNIFLVGKDKAIITSVLNGESIQSLFSVLSKVKLIRTMIFDMGEGLDLITETGQAVFDYSRIFSPTQRRWSIDMEELEQELVSKSRAVS